MLILDYLTCACVMLSVTFPAGCRCHWLSVFRGRCHWAPVPGILSDPAPECCWAESRAHAQSCSTLVQREGVLSQPVRARPDRKRAAKYNLKCWHDSNSGKLRGRSERPGHRTHSYISVTWVRRERRGDQYGHWWTVIQWYMARVGEWRWWSQPRLWTNGLTNMEWGVLVSLPGQCVWVDSGQGWEGTEKVCQEQIKQDLLLTIGPDPEVLCQWTPFFCLCWDINIG